MSLNVDRSHSARSNLTVLQRMDPQIMYEDLDYLTAI
jgi:hypothetical protein